MNCDSRVFARCPYKRTCVDLEHAQFPEGSDCHLFNQKILQSAKTVGDWIRGMDDLELATFLYTATRACSDHDCSVCPIGAENCCVMLQWIKKQEINREG